MTNPSLLSHVTAADARDELNHPVRFVTSLIRRRWWIVLAMMVLCGGAAFVVSSVREEEFEANAVLLLRDPGFDDKLFGDTSAPTSSGDPQRTVDTDLRLVKLPVVAERAGERLNLPGARVSDAISVRQAGQSNVIVITATQSDAVRAAELANVFAEEYVAFRKDADRQKIEEAQELVDSTLAMLSPRERSGLRGRELTARANELEILASLQTGNAEVVQPALIPGSPSAPRPLRDTVLALMFGFIVGFASAVVAERLDRRISAPEDFEDVFGLPILAALTDNAQEAQRDAGVSMSPLRADAFRMLRANLRYFNTDTTVKTVLITSAAPGEGKSTVGWDLSETAAYDSSRVLFIEADLRRPTVVQTRGIESGPGLGQVLSGEIEFQNAVQHVALSPQLPGPMTASMDVLISGPPPPNPASLLDSRRMCALLEDVRDQYDLIVIDTPPVAVVPDAIPLLRQADGVIVVGHSGRTTRDQASHLRDQLERLRAPSLGVVLNRLSEKGSAYGYGYGYSYGYENTGVSAFSLSGPS